jgi:hypothetical protein
LLSEGSNFSWVDDLPGDAYIFGDSKNPRSLVPIFELLNRDIPYLVSKENAKAFEILGVRKEDLPIDGVQSGDEMISYIKNCFDVSRRALEEIKGLGYVDIFMECNKTIRRLYRARVDMQRLEAAIKANEIKNVNIAKTFFPNNDGYLQLPEYSITKTLTGRMTITSGPQILTAPKLIRKYLTSSYDGGKIAQVDFVSLEPRVGMQLSDEDPGVDVYEYLGKKLFNGKVSRRLVKKLVLCAAYGASESTLKRDMPDEVDIKSMIEKTKEILNYERVIKEQKLHFQKSGKIRNFFGRPVEPQHARESLLYNNYIQSTAVDVALLGFGKILDLAPKRVLPIFFIHDAMIVDLHPDDIEEFKNASSSIVIDGLGEFPLDFQVLG